MYLNTGNKAFKGGHNSGGVTAPSLNWFLAEGSTGSFFSMYVLLANPNATAATLRATYILASGAPIVKTYSVAANSRRTVDVAGEDRRAGRHRGVGEGRVDQRRGGHRRAHDVVDGIAPQLDGRAQRVRHDADRRRAGCWRKARRAARAPSTPSCSSPTPRPPTPTCASRCCRRRAPRNRSTYTVGANRRFTVPVATRVPVVGRQALLDPGREPEPVDGRRARRRAGDLLEHRRGRVGRGRQRGRRDHPLTAGAGRASRGRAAASLVPVSGDGTWPRRSRRRASGSRRRAPRSCPSASSRGRRR